MKTSTQVLIIFAVAAVFFCIVAEAIDSKVTLAWEREQVQHCFDRGGEPVYSVSGRYMACDTRNKR